MCNRLRNMYNIGTCLRAYGFFCLMASAGAVAQSVEPAIVVRAIAEVAHGAQLSPAKRVVSGDRVLYTLEVRNASATTAAPPRVDYAIPAHTWYVAESAVGPGTEVTYSVDGGLNFDRPENLRILSANGEMRSALPADYTHIRWQFKNSLKANSIAFLRFRILVK